MFFLLYWTLKIVAYFLMGLFFAAFFVGLVMWTLLRVIVSALFHLFAGRPVARRDEPVDQPAAREDQIPTFGSYRVSVDDDRGGMTPALEQYLVERH